MDIIQKIHRCCDYRSFTQLNEDLHKIGLSISQLYCGKHILCKIEDGRIKADEVLEDYVYLEKQSLLEEITNTKKEIILDFIERNKSSNQLNAGTKSYHNNYQLYGRSFGV